MLARLIAARGPGRKAMPELIADLQVGKNALGCGLNV